MAKIFILAACLVLFWNAAGKYITVQRFHLEKYMYVHAYHADRLKLLNKKSSYMLN